VLWVTAGETAGFAVPAVVGVLTRDAAPAIGYVALLFAGLVEGAALGWAQAHVLRRALPRLDGARFVRLTSLAAAFAYAVGMTPALVGERLTEWPIVVTVSLGAVLGTALLASIGTAQWLELRHCLPRATSWIASTAVAWLIGLAVFMGVATPLWREGQPVAWTIAVGIGAGLLMAASVAALSGAAMLRLVRRR
jgi:hypothetical protein